MNRLLLFLLTLLGGGAAMYFSLPWFLIALVALVIGYVVRVRRRSGFWFSFLAGLFVWGGYAVYLQLINDGILAARMAGLFGLGSGWWMVITTGLWGGLTAGLGGWTGVNLRKALLEEDVEMGTSQ